LIGVDFNIIADGIGRKQADHRIGAQPFLLDDFLKYLRQAEFVDADVNALLRERLNAGERFDAIVLDPPKFAPSAAHAERAARAYKDINRLALMLLAPGGLLFTFSCSGGISAELFHKIVAGAGLDAGVDGVLLDRLAGACDHPTTITFPEGEYLKGLVVLKHA